MFFLFFFSSRRRHTRFDCDWSSDVCSSDLKHGGPSPVTPPHDGPQRGGPPGGGPQRDQTGTSPALPRRNVPQRSEERRVGEEGRSRGSPDHLKKKKKISDDTLTPRRSKLSL